MTHLSTNKTNDDKLSNDAEEKEGVLLDIPICLMYDIFSRLQVIDLTRLKCLSKYWCDSLSDPYFLSLHRHQSLQNPSSSFFFFFTAFSHFDCNTRPFQYIGPDPELMDEDLKEFEVDLHLSTADHEGRPISEFTKQVKVDKWQGLVLQPSNKELICVSTSRHIYICNPSTHEFIELPDHHKEMQHLPPMTLFGVGFGFVPSTMDYKVVRLFDIHLDYENFDEYEISCEVLTISSSSTVGSNNSSSYSWRVIEGGCPYPVFDLSLAIDKFVIWKVGEWFVGAQERDEVIFCFNLETEKFSSVPPPHCVTNQIEFGLAALKGELWLMEPTDTHSYMNNMWMLKDWNRYIWVKQYSIDIKSIVVWGWWSPIDIIQYGEDGEVIVLLRGNGGLHYYHVQSKRITPLGDISPVKFCYYIDSFFKIIS